MAERKKDKEPSMNQLTWTIQQTSYLTGNSPSTIRRLITDKVLSEDRGEYVKLHSDKYDRIMITRKGMTRITGYEFPRVEYTQLAQELLRLAKV